MSDEMTDRTSAVVLDRTFDASADEVWRMWTEPDHFAAWYGPDGADVTVAALDARVGGRRHVCLAFDTPEGAMQMWFVGEHLIVERPTRLVYTESLADADGNVRSPEDAGLPPGHPAVTEITVELVEVDGRTRLTLTHAGVPADSPGATGWTMALTKLERHLRTGSSS